MPYYRLLTNLSMGNTILRHGAIQQLNLSQRKLNGLVERGAISQISTPPLEILPGWEERAARLKSQNIQTIEDLFTVLDDTPETIARLFEMETSDVLQWRKELERDWLSI